MQRYAARRTNGAADMILGRTPSIRIRQPNLDRCGQGQVYSGSSAVDIVQFEQYSPTSLGVPRHVEELDTRTVRLEDAEYDRTAWCSARG